MLSRSRASVRPSDEAVFVRDTAVYRRGFGHLLLHLLQYRSEKPATETKLPYMLSGSGLHIKR